MLLCIAILWCSEVRGQTVYGFRIGANVATLSSGAGESSDPEPVVGLLAGSFVRYELRNSWAVQGEILYSVKGAQFQSETESGTPLEETLQPVYLEVPLLLHRDFSISSSLRASLYAGPFAAFEISERIQQRVEGFVQAQDSDVLDSPDLGVTLGGDLFFEASSLDAILGLRYSYGLRGLTSEDIDSERSPATRSLSVTIGFLF